MLGIGGKSIDLNARRCGDCGFVEFYVELAEQPVGQLRSVEEEHERLLSLVAKLQERVGTLEAIATDPGIRTAREIEALRTTRPQED